MSVEHRVRNPCQNAGAAEPLDGVAPAGGLSPKERGILFSAPMVRAVLEGRKTQTRRLVDPTRCMRPGALQAFSIPEFRGTFGCPYGVPGERLWVRETWAVPPGSDDPREVAYRADLGDITPKDDRRAGRVWTPSIYMRRQFSRITLEVTEIRLERLQDISNSDAVAEGVACWICGAPVDGSSENDCVCFHTSLSARGSYVALWDSINGKRAPWESNPWVWAVSFRPIPAAQPKGER